MLRAYELVLAAAVAIGVLAFGVAGALAIPAPHYHVGGEPLLEGRSVEFQTKVANNFVWKAGGAEIECSNVEADKGATLKGSGVKEPIEDPGTSEEKLKFSSCIVKGNGPKCKILDKLGGDDGVLETEALKNELVYLEDPMEEPVKGTMIGVEFTPVTGTVIAKFYFEECETFKGKQEARGSVAGLAQVQNKGGANLSVAFDENELEYAVTCEGTKTCGVVRFPPAVTVETVWRVQKGKAEAASVKLTLFGKAATFSGEALVNLEKSWGVFAAK